MINGQSRAEWAPRPSQASDQSKDQDVNKIKPSLPEKQHHPKANTDNEEDA